MSDGSVELTRPADGLAVVRFTRPEQRNAMNAIARASLIHALEETRRDGTRVIVLRGDGPAFCAGIDLKEVAAGAGDPNALWGPVNAEWRRVQQLIRDHPAVVIASVNGYALGGGSTLINVCDLAVAADVAQIGMPEVGFGSYPGIAGPAMQLRVSPKRAAWLVLTARRIDGRTAEEWGVVNRCVPLDELEAETMALARHVAGFDAATLTWSKRALWQIPGRLSDWEAAVDFGDYTNAQIQAASSTRDAALQSFARGERNQGQGPA